MAAMTKQRQDAGKAEKADVDPSSEKANAVAQVLAAAQGDRVSASVFFDDSVPAADVERKIGELVDKAREALPASGHEVKIGTPSKLAKSVGLEVDRDMFKEICRSADVKTVLPSKIKDIKPKPVGSKRRPIRRD